MQAHGYLHGVAREILPLFPLSNVVLFPRIHTPLHLFEPRYRQLAEDVVSGEQRIGMVVVRPEHAEDMPGDPPVFPVGCGGVVEQSQRLPDGRFNLLLLGTQRFRIVREEARPPGRLYRVAEVELLDEAKDPADAARTVALRARVIELVADFVRRTDSERLLTPDAFDAVDDATLVNSLCNAFTLPTREKQGLLEADSVRERFARLANVLSFALAELDAGGTPNTGSLH